MCVQQNFLIQMLKLNLYRFKIIYIWDDKTFLQGKRFEVYSSPEYYPKQQL